MQIVKKFKVVYVSFIFFCALIGLAFAADTDSLVVTENGNVGIGTTDPAYKLHVDTGSNGYIDIEYDTNQYGGIAFHENGIASGYIQINGTTVTDKMEFFVGGGGIPDRKMVIQDDGKVGVGDSSPDARLDVYGSAPDVPTMMVDRRYDGSRVQFTYANSLNDIGEIGMTSNAGVGSMRLWMGANLNSVSTTHTNPTQHQTTRPSWITQWSSAGDYYSVSRIAPSGSTNIDTIFHIHGSGNVGIGTTTPESKLSVSGRIQVNSDIASVFLNDTRSGGAKFQLDSGMQEPGMFSITHNGVARRLVIDSSGNVGIATLSPSYKLDVNGTIRGSNVSPSDARWKKDIEPIDDALARVSQLRGVHYRWVDQSRGEGVQVGVVAQQVEEVFPEVVSTDNQGYKSVAYGKLVAPLIEAIKELKAENEDLKAENQEFRARLEALSDRLTALEDN